MIRNLEKQKSKGERTLLTALLLSAPGPIVTLISVLSGRSATQIADFLRRTAELMALFVSWFIYCKLQRNPGQDIKEQAKLERVANLWVGGAMMCAGAAMLTVAIYRLSFGTPGGNVVMGLVIAVLGFVTNTWFFIRYRVLASGQHSAVLDAQQKLYRAKAVVDFFVTAALLTVAIAPSHPATRYIDVLGSLIVACYLLCNGIGIMRKESGR